MFRFKDSNFYLNQVCVPDANVATGILYNGSRVDYNPVARTAAFNANGDYIVIGEQLNRDKVVEAPGAYAFVKDGYVQGEPVRLFRLANLVGLEFVTAVSASAVAPYASNRVETAYVDEYYGINESGELVCYTDGEIRFKCIGVNGSVVTLICTDEHEDVD